MKRYFLYIFIIAALGCSKEKYPPLLFGKWTIVESNAGTGYSVIKTNYQPQTDITIDFQPDGRLLLSGPNPGTANSSLWMFNRYEILSENAIRFSNTATSDTMRAYFTFDSSLSFWYDWARCGYEEKFLRIK